MQLKYPSFLLILLFLCTDANATKLTGKVTDEKGLPLPYASVYVKGTSQGTATNLEGHYTLELGPGNYTIVCQYIGHLKQEVSLIMANEAITKNFILIAREKGLKEVTVRVGEDPALRIIRETIRKRSSYVNEVDDYKAEVYIKGSISMDDINSSPMMMMMMGMSGKDSSAAAKRNELEESKGIIMLSESYCDIYSKRPDKLKVIVKSSRVSGNQSAYGFSYPMNVDLYDNHVSLGKQLSPRGFVSPISETALLYYRYELLDTYQEDGKTISVVNVIPRRLFEPLFSGQLHIIENEWRLYQVDLITDKSHQLEVLDTLRIKQLYIPVGNTYMIKDQSFKMKFNLMGFKISGNFVNVFTNYQLGYDTKAAFNKYLMEFDSAALKQPKIYWDTLRPVPLDSAEVVDYRRKDSIELAEKSKKDTLKKSKTSLSSLLIKGYFKTFKGDQRIRTSPLAGLNQINWNTVEGVNYNFHIYYSRAIQKDRLLKSKLDMRYGFSNKQFNASWTSTYSFGKTHKTKFRFSTGRSVYQYNQQGPVNEMLNSWYTLFAGRNYLKILQAWFGELSASQKFVNGLSLDAKLFYQDRTPLVNTNLFSYRKKEKQDFTPNYPIEQLNQAEPRHQALITQLGISFQPGRKFIKYPDRIVATQSTYPTFHLQYSKGLNLLGSDVQFDRWKLGIEDDIYLQLWGTFSYNAHIGGFINKQNLFLSDYTHFNGNQLIVASPYLNSFQLSSYYANSNTESFYTTAHAEHHFNGLITNKIPLFRRLKWYLVAGSNAYYVNRTNNYIECSVGLENIGYKMVRFLRIDGVAGYNNFKNPVYGVRIGIASSAFKFGRSEDD